MGIDCLIAQTFPNTWTYRASRFKSISLESNAPVMPLPLPESKAFQAELFKLEGNLEIFNLTFMITDESTDRVTGYVPSTKTVIEQLIFLFDQFQTESFEHRYTFTFEGTSFTRTGVITKIAAVTDETDPVNYNCTVTFQVGVVLGFVESEDAA